MKATKNSAVVWSYGGGIQTVAIACLIHQGRLPKPDRIVIADTGYEFTETWKYTDKYIVPLLADIGLKIEIAPHSLSKVDIYSKDKKEVLIPAYDATKVNDKGDHAKLRTFCSSEWKTKVVRRYIGGSKLNPKGVLMWIGMSLDEQGRMKASGVDWCKNYWPLAFNVKMKRNECRDLIRSLGIPSPLKSRCKMCPHQQDDEWIEIQNNPQEFSQAVAIDEMIFKSHGLRLHSSCLPLSQVVFVPRGKETPLYLFDCMSGACNT